MPFATWELGSEYPIEGFLAVTKAGSDCCSLAALKNQSEYPHQIRAMKTNNKTNPNKLIINPPEKAVLALSPVNRFLLREQTYLKPINAEINQPLGYLARVSALTLYKSCQMLMLY